MSTAHENSIVIEELQGYSGIRLKDDKALRFDPGINLLVGRNGCGKTNLLHLVQFITAKQGQIHRSIESTFFRGRAKKALASKHSSIDRRFGRVEVCRHWVKGKAGKVTMSLKNVYDEQLLLNLIKKGNWFHGNIELNCETIPVSYRGIQVNSSPPKIEMSGNSNFARFFSGELNNPVHDQLSEPIRIVEKMMKHQFSSFYKSKVFENGMHELEVQINQMLDRFLGPAGKRIKLNHDLLISGDVFLELMDGDNVIESAAISTGETRLLNLVLTLAELEKQPYDVVTFDEPDLHMHEDMIQVLVDELVRLANAHPHMIMLVTSHSTAMIEKLASVGSGKVNIITFDSERRVSNSQDDIELINALVRNGVTFSPLMLSRRKNIFIENQFRPGDKHREFLLKVFSNENMPNIIPIGTSGNVLESDSFMAAVQEIVKISKGNAIGVLDGDMWFKGELRKYLSDKLTLEKFLDELDAGDKVYRPLNHQHKKIYCFNFWEIENLYLMDELLPCWRASGRRRLSKKAYGRLLQQNREVISHEYLNMFLKMITHFKIGNRKSLAEMRGAIGRMMAEAQEMMSANAMEGKIDALVEGILKKELFQWVPGKEAGKLLKQKGYTFDDTGFDYGSSTLAISIREILKF